METPDTFKLNWMKLWARPQRSPDAAAVDTRVVANVSAAVAVPARERPAALLSTLALAGKDLVRQFSEPTYASGPNPGGEYFGFRNGIIVLIQSGKTSAYGVYARP